VVFFLDSGTRPRLRLRDSQRHVARARRIQRWGAAQKGLKGAVYSDFARSQKRLVLQSLANEPLWRAPRGLSRLTLHGKRLPFETAVFFVSRPPEGAVTREIRGLRSVALAVAGIFPPSAQLIPAVDGREAALAERPIGAMLAERHRCGPAFVGTPLSTKVFLKGLSPVGHLVAVLARRRRPQPTRSDVVSHAPPKTAVAAAGFPGPSVRHVPAR